MARVTGLKEVLKNVEKVKGATAKGVERGLVKAGLFLQRASQELVPIDTGALRNSAFTRKEGAGFKTKVSVGYTQNYAIYVHENLDAHHGPGKVAKFLETPAREHRDDMLAIVREEARLK